MNQTSPEQRLAELGIVLPPPPKPVAAYIPCRVAGSQDGRGGLVFVSGQIPLREGRLIATGVVPTDVPLETAQQCARQCVLNGLAILRGEVGTLDRVKRVIRVGCFVASEHGFTDQPKVANGASELLVEIFGESGRHARAAVGSIALPLGAPVEVEFVFEVD